MSPLQTIVGFILPPKDKGFVENDGHEGSDTEEEEEEGDEPEFLDYTEICNAMSGGVMIKGTQIGRTQVRLYDFKTKKEYCAEGKFTLLDPWWMVTCKGRLEKEKMVMMDPLSYQLRTDVKEDIMNLFFTACDVHHSHVMNFRQWLKAESGLNFENLLELLDEFQEVTDGQYEKVPEQMKKQVTQSVAGRRVFAAAAYPHVMKHLPTLLPKHFLELLQKGKDPSNKEEVDKSLLGRLEHIIRTEAWKLGFSDILHKELGLMRCEATVKALQACGLFQTITTRQKNALLVYTKLKKDCYRIGSTYVDLEDLREDRPEDEHRKAVSFLKTQGVVVVTMRTRVALKKLYTYETGIANCLEQLLSRSPYSIDLDAKKVLQKSIGTNSGIEMDLDLDQVRAAEMICANPISIISGKGGCGKTTVVCQVLKAAMEKLRRAKEEVKNAPQDFETITEAPQEPISDKVEVLLTAPIGRAAALLTKKTEFKAYTLHQVVWSFMNEEKDDSGAPKKWKFSSVRVFVVDEGSLMCVQIFHSVLTMLTKYSQLQKIIILGDLGQLPSIRPGNVLSDLFNSMLLVHWATEMKTNHRAESELIVKNARLISEMGEKKYCDLEWDATVDMNSPFKKPPPDSHFIAVFLPQDDRGNRSPQRKPGESVRTPHRKDPGPKPGPSHSYFKHLQTAVTVLLEHGPGLETDKSSQFIAFSRKECALINELCWDHKHRTGSHKKKPVFRQGDKVCCTRNGFVTDLELEKEWDRLSSDTEDDTEGCNGKKNVKKRLCNGQIFFINNDVTVVEAAARGRRRYLTLDDNDGCNFTVLFKELQKECKIQHAWAKTIHTFQGSEAETVVYILGSGWYQHWKHVYTAVTRGQKRVYVLMCKDSLKKVIERRVTKRKTQLKGLVNQVIAQMVRTEPRPAAAARSSHPGDDYDGNKTTAKRPKMEAQK
ncbi:DNA helicase B isoform X2 [Paramormyrops kingsleyae]|uniref:DNA helicase B isoform X2 n=1 Tax=Paramormyrops kingsleyae TaxID=1676925 RepID=UPI003B96B26F